ncbi:MAG TPA: response regulator [Candidatus Babeliales bacterium]|nr:response regulator [Candidatus Babeliales bacterium]
MAEVLILDTDRQFSKNLAKYLGGEGHSATAYVEPQQAILGVDTKHPHIIILDLILAGRSGIEFLYELRSYPEWQNTPVLVVSRLSSDEVFSFQPAFRQLNVSDYLNKTTTSLSDLREKIEQVLMPAAA